MQIRMAVVGRFGRYSEQPVWRSAADGSSWRFLSVQIDGGNANIPPSHDEERITTVGRTDCSQSARLRHLLPFMALLHCGRSRYDLMRTRSGVCLIRSNSTRQPTPELRRLLTLPPLPRRIIAVLNLVLGGPAYFGAAAAVSPGGMIRNMKLDTFSPGLNGSGTSLSIGFTL